MTDFVAVVAALRASRATARSVCGPVIGSVVTDGAISTSSTVQRTLARSESGSAAVLVSVITVGHENVEGE